MTISPLILSFVPVSLLLIPLSILLFFFKSSRGKGIIGEFIVNLMIKIYLDKKKYYLVKNVTFPTDSGTTQIDHIIVSKYGIFVIETKNMKGWIFGTEKQKKWTQKIYNYSVSFQNPLRQNYKHTKVLSSLINIDHGKIFSLIVFVGGEIKTEVPENVTYAKDSIRFIQSKRVVLFSETEVEQIRSKIAEEKLTPNLKTHRAHVAHLKLLHSEASVLENRPVTEKFDISKGKLCMDTGGGFPGYRSGLTKILVKEIHGSGKQDNRFWQSEFNDVKDLKRNQNSKSLLVACTLLLGVILAIIMLRPAFFESRYAAMFNGFFRKGVVVDSGIKAIIATPQREIESTSLQGSTDHTFSKTEIERVAQNLLKKTNGTGLSQKRIITSANQKGQISNRKTEGSKYLYDIEMLSGGRITADKVSISDGKVTYGNERGLIVSINASEVKSVSRKKIPY